MGNAPRKAAYPKSASSVGSASKKVRWGVGLEVPSPPGKPILVPGEEDADPVSVGIRWERSPHNGGTAIIGYIVELRKMGSPNWVRSAPFLCTFPELILSGLEPGWRYQFRVKAQNAVGVSDPSELSDPLTVTLQRAAAVCPQFENELSDVIAIENDQVEFTVSFTGSPLPKISWYKDGFEIFSSRRTKIITENGKSNLMIHRTALDDEGEIKCTATNRAGHVSTKARLILEAPPRIRLPRQYADGLLFEQDETIRLKVSLAGKPHPTITWYHDGEPIIQDSRHVFDNIDGESTMKIPDAKRMDRGEYIVKASNKLGEDVASVLVTVTDRPAAPGKANVKMTLGRSVALSWEEPVDDGGCKIGTYIVEYYRVGWNMWLKATTSRQTIAVLNDLIEGSEYRFRVKAENPYGVSDPSEESDPVFIPDLKRGITMSNMLEKSQSSKEIHRGRSEKREVSFVEPSQRTRSLTREDKNGRSKAPQRSSAPVKPPRTDSRVTFALDTFDDKETPSKAESSNHVNKKPVTADPVYKLVLTEPETVKPKENLPETKQTTIQTNEKPGNAILKRQISPEPLYRATKSPDSILNPRRQLSPEPTSNFKKQKSPELPSTFGRQRSPEPPASFRRQQSPEPSVTSIKQKSPEPSTISGRQTSPEPNATFRRQKSPEPFARFRRQKSPEPSASPRRLRSPEPSAAQRHLSPDPSNRTGASSLDQYSNLSPTSVSSNSKRSFFLNKSKSADEYDESAFEEYNDHLMNDSSEFMLVLYPKVMTDSLIDKYESLDTNVHIEEITDKGNFQPQHQESSYETEDEDLIPPPISFSLPELFSPNHEIIEIIREAVSSTELLHEHAMERFYRAVEAEKAANEAKLNSANASNKVTKQDSFKLFDAKTYNPRRRLSNSGAQAYSWHVKKGRRRSHDQKGNPTLTELLTPGNLESVSSDSNLHLNKSVRLSREYETEKLHHWPKTDDYHFKDDVKQTEMKKQLLEEEKVSSSGDVSIRSEDDVEFLKSRILAAVVAREEDTYHPSGRMVVHKELDEDMEKTKNNNSGTMPKSILKKRVEIEPVPVNQFGRPIPPEVPIDRSGYQKSDPQITRAVSPTKTLSRNEYDLMTDFEKDSVTVLSAAEAAKDRRKQVKQPSSSFEIDEEKLAEERMAVVSHYTEIVNEYSMAHLPFPPRPSSRQSVSSEGSSVRSPQEPKVVMRDHRNAPKPDSHFSQASFHPTPEPPTVIATKPERNPVLSKIVIPLDKNQILMETESQLKSLQTQPEQRARSSSRTRRTSRTRSPSQPRSVSQSRSSSQTRAKARSRKSSNVDSSRPHSRMSSCDRSRADKKIERETKSQNNGIRSRRNSTHSNVHTFGPSKPDLVAAVEKKVETDFLTQIKAEMNVKRTISFITDISLLFAAMYVYIFKREIFALPFILLLLYRHIQNEVKSLFSGRLFKSQQP